MKTAADMVKEFHLKHGAFVYPPGVAPVLVGQPGVSGLRVIAAHLRQVKDRVINFQSAVSRIDEGDLLTRDGDVVPEVVKVLRVRLMIEELSELVDAICEGDVVEVADGLADLKYVTEGTAISLGIPMDEVFAEVHRSNMTKTPLDSVGKGGKVTKDGYEPPDLKKVLKLQ